MELSKYSLKESILFSRIFAFYITIQTRYLNFSLLRFSTYLSLLLRKTVLLIRLCKYGVSMSLEIYGMYRVIFEVFNCSFTMFVNQYLLLHFLLYCGTLFLEIVNQNVSVKTIWGPIVAN